MGGFLRIWGGILDPGGFGIAGIWDPGDLGFGVPLPCASPPEVRTAMALPTPRVSVCRGPTGLGDIFLPEKKTNKQTKRKQKQKIGKFGQIPRREGRLCPSGWRCQRRVAPLGDEHGDRDSGTAPLPPPGHSRPGGRWGTPYWSQSVLTGANLGALLVPVPPYRGQSVLTGATLSLLVPVCIPYSSQSLFPVVTGLPSLLVPVYPPYWS